MSLLSRLNRTLGAAPAPVEGPTDADPDEKDVANDDHTGRLAAALERCGAALARRQPTTPTDTAAGSPIAHSAFSGAPQSFADALPTARIIDTEDGGVWSVRTEIPLTARHGEVAIGDLDALDFGDLAVATADERLAGFDPRRAIFVDLETTGLEHGGGNVAFIIAAGWFEPHAFCIEQLILKDHDEEYAMLSLIWRWLHAHPYLVSFNGKSFDLSILQNRLVLHRFSSEDRAAVKLRPHLDLLHVSRAFFKGAWPDTRLQTMEREALGFHRDDDMPGALAPVCFFTWLRTDNARPLGHIATHNRDDVLTMVALANVLAALSAPGGPILARPEVALNLARRLVRLRNPLRALDYLDPLAGDEALELDAATEVAELGLTACRRLGFWARGALWATRLLSDTPDHGAALRMLKRAERESS